MNILLAIDEAAGLRVLKQLLASRHNIAGILTSPSSVKNGGIYTLAGRSNIVIHDGRLARDWEFAGWIKAQKVDLLVSVHFSYIFCEEVIQAPTIGSFNLHPGSLPQYAGLNPISWAIFNGEKNYGVTLHWITRDIDGGPIAYHAPVIIDETDTAYQLMAKCVAQGVKLVHRLVDAASQSKESIPAIAQDSDSRHYYDGSVPQNGWVDWYRPAKDILNLVRACDFAPFDSPWGSPKTRINGQVIELLKLSYSGRSACGAPGTVLVDDNMVMVSSLDEALTVELVKIKDERRRPLDALRQGDLLV